MDCRVWGLGLRVWAFKVWGIGCWAFGVWGLGLY